MTDASRNVLRHVTLATLPPVLVALFQSLTWPLMSHSPWLLFVPALFLSSAVGGLRASLLATTATAIAVPWLYTSTVGVELPTPEKWFAGGIVLASGLMFGLFFERMRKTESLLRDLFDHASDGLFIADLNGRYTKINRTGARMLGYEPEELIGKTILDLVPPAETERLWQSREDMLGGGIRIDEWQLRCKDGSYLSVEVSAKILPDGRWQGFVRDIKERKEHERQLRTTATVFSTTSEGILITNAEAEIIEVNTALEIITGYNRDELLGKNPRILNSGRQDETFYQQMWTAIHAGGQWQGEIWNRRKNGDIYPAWENISAVRDENGVIQQLVSIQADISTLKQVEEKLNHLANHDVLTSLPNRMLFNATLGAAIERAKRHRSRLALLFLDLDRFKLINDTLGHRFGDLLLQEVATRLRHCVRAEDMVARLVGDEFTIILEDITDANAATPVAHKILTALNAPVRIEGRDIATATSIGISLFPNDATNADDLLRTADAAMYLAKERGRNTFQFYTEELTTRAAELLVLEQGIRHALENDEFCMYFQPQCDLKSGHIVAAEALLRWRHPHHGLMPTGRLIAVAEQSDLMELLGDWILRDVCRQYKSWLQQGVSVPWISINLSGRQLLYDHTLQTLEQALSDNDLRAGETKLEFEVTETMLQSLDRSLPALQRLRELGFRNVIDDFGTGYSSLSLLQHLPIDTVKIAEAFVRNLPAYDDNRTITTAIISLAHALGLSVVAEGVETQEQLNFLRQQGCDRVQGFYTGAAMPADDFAALLKVGAAVSQRA